MNPTSTQRINSVTRLRVGLTATVLVAAMTTSLLPAKSFAAGESCATVFRIQPKSVAALADAGYEAHNVDAYNAVQRVKRSWPSLSEKRELMGAIEELLNEESLSTFHIFVKEIMTKVADRIEGSRGGGTQKTRLLKEVWLEHLNAFLTPSEARSRLSLLENEALTKTDLMRALGQQTAEETLHSLIGARGIQHPAATSLVGRYLARARELGVNVSTFVGRFDKGPDAGAPQGHERLYIAVDHRTMALAKEIFGKNHHHMIHNHSSGQGTLSVVAMGGKRLYYASNRGETNLDSYRGTILPIITLSTTEAANVQNYGDLGSIDQKLTKYPWGYSAKVKGEMKKNYCIQGGYASCTHWWFEMPVGDTLVDKYRMPKANGDDQYGRSDDGLSDRDRSRVREKKVGRYTHFSTLYEGDIKIENEQRDHRLVRMVWGQGKGHMQLWQTLGIPKSALDDGSGANPGWVLYTLVGKASPERVPVVLVVRDDATEAITAQTLKSLKANIDPH